MNKVLRDKIRRAISGSIKKWDKIAINGGFDRRSHNCPLCGIFNRFPNQCQIKVSNDTMNCPVVSFVEKTTSTVIDPLNHAEGCYYTPYCKWLVHQQEHIEQYYKHKKMIKSTHTIIPISCCEAMMACCPECVELAIEERAFLEKVLEFFTKLG